MSIEKSTLDKLGIHELRDLARQVGVHLPTTMKRDDLINEIMAIISGEKEPHKRNTNRGRPAKMSRNYNDLTEMLLPTANSSIDSNKFVFNASDVEYLNTNEKDFVGYIKVYENYGVIRTKELELIYVTYAIISKYELIDGDYIMGFAKESKDSRYIVTSVLKINNVIDVHHIHVISIDGQRNYATMHIVTNGEPHEIKEKVRKELNAHGICHITIELEKEDEICSEKFCSTDFNAAQCHHHH